MCECATMYSFQLGSLLSVYVYNHALRVNFEIFFFFNNTATTEIYTLSLHDALPICSVCELLRDLSGAHGKTIVMVTHEPTVAAYAHEVAVLKDGKLISRFPTEQEQGAERLAARYQIGRAHV